MVCNGTTNRPGEKGLLRHVSQVIAHRASRETELNILSSSTCRMIQSQTEVILRLTNW